MFNGVAPLPVSSPNITISTPTSNEWVRGTINIAGVAQDYAGLSSVALSIDGNPVTTITTNLSNPTFPVDTTTMAEGFHTFMLSVTNVAGLTTTASGSFGVDNTPPTVAAAVTGTGGTTCHVTGSAADILSGVNPNANNHVDFADNRIPPESATVHLALTNNTFSFDPAFTFLQGPTYTFTLHIFDSAGNERVEGHTYVPVFRCSVGANCNCTIQ